jgi:hypothetical protein
MTRHQVETELSDIRREITRLQRREAMLLNGAQDDALPRPGWPMRRTNAGLLAIQIGIHASGAMISTSEPSRIAV